MNRRHFFKILAGIFGSTLLAKFLPENFWSAWSVPPRGLENPLFSGMYGNYNGFLIFERDDFNNHVAEISEEFVKSLTKERFFLVEHPSPLEDLK